MTPQLKPNKQGVGTSNDSAGFPYFGFGIYVALLERLLRPWCTDLETLSAIMGAAVCPATHQDDKVITEEETSGRSGTLTYN